MVRKLRNWIADIVDESISQHHNIYTSELNCVYEAFGKIHDRLDDIETLIHENKQLKEENEKLKARLSQQIHQESSNPTEILKEWLGGIE